MKSSAERKLRSLLQIVDRLEVGPPQIEPRRIRATYTVSCRGSQASRQLIVRYPEDVFDPEDPESLNLASLITAQVAVNYGLVCREIVFHGSFDAADRAFLEAAATITARDIYLRKLLRPKAFYTDWVRRIPVVQLESYLLAQLRFPRIEEPSLAASGLAASGLAASGLAASGLAASDPAPVRDAPPSWPGDPNRVALLASGGKDSLLTHRLLEESGREAHPVFINEAGKHWFTALNAYRRFAAEGLPTARVWTNSDRLFAFLLRQMPFVKPRFTRYGLNGYPIRIWTVPIFLFNALPILRRRGIPFLAVGNEYDTTIQGRAHGLDHHFCLYDQSRDFEHELNRYLSRKGWGVTVFSVLRSLSGLLIQRQLLEHYPKTLPLQMSCHRAHSGGDRILPCGSCEKCAGVVAMLLAFGGDPAVCGYTETQIEDCLRRLPERGPWLEIPGLQHLAWLLAERGLLPEGSVSSFEAAQRDEVMSLRFDDDASSLEDLPPELRPELLPLLLRGAQGAVYWSDEEWRPFNPLVPK